MKATEKWVRVHQTRPDPLPAAHHVHADTKRAMSTGFSLASQHGQAATKVCCSPPDGHRQTREKVGKCAPDKAHCFYG